LHRYYDPAVGRYISADPIGQLGGINGFEYALGNPVNASDPLGLGPDNPDDGGGIAKSLRDAATRIRDAALDKAVDLLLSGRNKLAVCEEKKRACVAQNCPDPGDFQEEYEKCQADFVECVKNAGSQILDEESSGVPDPFGVTGPDIGKSKTPNVIDRFSRGRGKKE